MDGGRRVLRTPSSLCVEVQPTNIAGKQTGNVSSSPTSSHGSKSNSPLLNGHTPTSGVSSKEENFSNHFFGSHKGFTLSPIKEKKPLASIEEPPDVIPVSASNSPYNMPERASSNSSDASTVIISNKTPNPGWNIKPATLPSNVWPPKTNIAPVAASAPQNRGGKVMISGPSLQASTNPAVVPTCPSKKISKQKDESPPPSYASIVSSTDTSSTSYQPSAPPLSPNGIPNSKTSPPPPRYNSVVAVITPTRRTPNVRPLSVPDASSLIISQNTGNNPVQLSNTDSSPKSDSSNKQSAVSRIASFLSKKDKIESEPTSHSRSNTLPRKAAKINRESLMQLEISAPCSYKPQNCLII